MPYAHFQKNELYEGYIDGLRPTEDEQVFEGKTPEADTICLEGNVVMTHHGVLELFTKYDKLIFEEYIGGQEVQVAVINGKPLGAIELVPERLFYDFKAKYTKKANTKHIMPANLPKKKYNEVLRIAKKTHQVLKCRGVTRTDFKFFKNNFYILELNTQPGMTSLSLVPEIAFYGGYTFENLVEKILLDASVNR